MITTRLLAIAAFAFSLLAVQVHAQVNCTVVFEYTCNYWEGNNWVLCSDEECDLIGEDFKCTAIAQETSVNHAALISGYAPAGPHDTGIGNTHWDSEPVVCIWKRPCNDCDELFGHVICNSNAQFQVWRTYYNLTPSGQECP